MIRQRYQYLLKNEAKGLNKSVFKERRLQLSNILTKGTDFKPTKVFQNTRQEGRYERKSNHLRAFGLQSV